MPNNKVRNLVRSVKKEISRWRYLWKLKALLIARFYRSFCNAAREYGVRLVEGLNTVAVVEI